MAVISRLICQAIARPRQLGRSAIPRKNWGLTEAPFDK
jgi:hypothetical protein